MPRLLSFDFDELIGLGITATILLGAVALLMLVCRQPLHRLHVARAGLLGVFLLPILSYLGLVPDLQRLSDINVALQLTSGWLGPKAKAIGMSPGILAHLRILPWSESLVDRSMITRWGSTFYLCGVAFGAIRLFLGLAGGWFLGSTATFAPIEIQNLYGRLGYRSRSRPQLRLSSRLGRPMLIGVIRPKILLPEVLAQRGPLESLEAILVHELAHAEARDPTFTLLIEFIQVFAFPVVPLWWVRSQIRLDQEFLADARTVEKLGDRVGYASSLISLSTSSSRTAIRFVPIRNSPNRDGSNLYRRILMLLRAPFELKTVSSIGWWAACLSIGLSVSIFSFLLRERVAVDLRPVTLQAVATRAESQKISDLTLSPNLADPARVTIPCPLVKNFVLEGQIYIDPASLDRVRVAGLHFGLPDQPSRFLSPWSYFPSWQNFRIEVKDSTTSLLVGRNQWELTRQSSGLGSLTFISTSRLPVEFTRMILRW